MSTGTLMDTRTATATRHAGTKPGDLLFHAPRKYCQNFIRSLASVIGPE